MLEDTYTTLTFQLPDAAVQHFVQHRSTFIGFNFLALFGIAGCHTIILDAIDRETVGLFKAPFGNCCRKMSISDIGQRPEYN